MGVERTPGDLGGKLRAARERRGLSLRDVAASTKISAHALDALEHNDARRLPGGIFSRAFVRSFAIAVGLDPDQAAREFLAQFPDEPPPPVRATTFEDGQALESRRRTASTVLALAGISVPVAAVLLYFGAAGRTPSPGLMSPRVVAPAPARASQPGPQVERASAPQATHGDARTPPPAPMPTAGETLTIVLAVTRPCWIAATVDGERAIARILQPGEQRTINVERGAVVTAGDAGAVQMTINGAAARTLGKDGQVVTAHVDLSNYKGFLASR